MRSMDIVFADRQNIVPAAGRNIVSYCVHVVGADAWRSLTLGFCDTSTEFNLGFLQIGIDSESKREYNYEHTIEAMKRYAIEKLKKWKDHPFRQMI